MSDYNKDEFSDMMSHVPLFGGMFAPNAETDEERVAREQASLPTAPNVGLANASLPASNSNDQVYRTIASLPAIAAPETPPSPVASNPLLAMGQKYAATKNAPPARDLKDTLATLLHRDRDEMGEAQASRNSLQLAALLNHAGNQAANALTPLAQKPIDSSATQAFLAAAQNPINDVKEAHAEEAKDRQLYETIAARKAQAQLMADYRNGLAAQKQEGKQKEALQQTMQMLEAARGNPEVQQALKDRYSASKAQLIFNKFPDNNVDTAHLKLLVPEVVKMASGTVPSISELEHNMPDGVQQILAGYKSRLLSSPQPSDAQAYVKVFKDYINDLNDNAQRVIKDKFGRVIDSKKNDLGHSNYATLHQQYLDPLANIATPQSGGFPKTVTNGTHQATVSNQQELEEAKQHGFN